MTPSNDSSPADESRARRNYWWFVAVATLCPLFAWPLALVISALYSGRGDPGIVQVLGWFGLLGWIGSLPLGAALAVVGLLVYGRTPRAPGR